MWFYCDHTACGAPPFILPPLPGFLLYPFAIIRFDHLDCRFRASLAASSARSLPVMPMWDGTHISLRFKPSSTNKSFNSAFLLFIFYDGLSFSVEYASLFRRSDFYFFGTAYYRTPYPRSSIKDPSVYTLVNFCSPSFDGLLQFGFRCSGSCPVLG
jgi:hypothetical protein